MISHIWNLKYGTNEPIYRTETDSDMEHRLVGGGGGSGMDWEFGVLLGEGDSGSERQCQKVRHKEISTRLLISAEGRKCSKNTHEEGRTPPCPICP